MTTGSDEEYPMEAISVLKQFGVASLEDAKELADLTSRIVANLKVIEEDDADLDGLLEQTTAIVANLKFIEDSNLDLDDFPEQTNAIVENLRLIEERT